MNEPAADDDAVWAELRREFAARVRLTLAEVDRELAALAVGTHADYARIEALLHRDAGAGAVFGFEDVSAEARRLEHLVQDLGDDTSAAALARLRQAIRPLQTIADGCSRASRGGMPEAARDDDGLGEQTPIRL